MRNFILLTILLIASHAVLAQVCTPDTNYSNPGIYPKDSILPQAEVNLPFEQLVTVIVPEDTTATVFNQKQVVLIDSIELLKTIGFPDWLSIFCDSTCIYPGGDTGCALLSGTPPDSIADTTYSLGFITITYARLAAIPTFPVQQVDTVKGYWSLTLNNPFISGLDKNFLDEFIKQAFIYENRLYVSGFNAEAGLVDMKLTNMAGQIVFRKSWREIRGKFNYNFGVPAMPQGVYLLTLEGKSGTEVKKLFNH